MNRQQVRGLPSLRRRIVGLTALVTSLGMAALLILMGVVLGRVVSDSVDGVLRDRADAVIATLDRAGDSLAGPESPDTLEEFVWVYDTAGRQVAGAERPTFSARLTELRTVDQTTTVEEDGWRLRAVPIVLDDDTVVSGVVVVGVVLAPYRTTEAFALLIGAAVGVLVIVGSSILAAWVVGRALHPVASMADSAAAWSEEDLTRRFDLGEPRDEITQLGQVLDGLLDRVSRAILAEQRLSAELAHELRSPLTVIRAEAEMANSADLTPGQHERLGRIMSSVDHMSEVIDTLMSIARGRGHREETASARQVIAEAVGRIDETSPLQLGDVPSTLTVAAPLSIASMALAPLIDNAVRYSRRMATVTAHPDGRFVRIEVSDDGPGIGDADPAQLFAPGFHDPASPGAGLGLSLARRLARTLGGDVVALDGQPTTFALILPRRAASSVRT